MAKVECYKCGWWDEYEDDDVLEALGLYAEHQLSVHPDTAKQDSAVILWIQFHAATIAATNGGYRP